MKPTYSMIAALSILVIPMLCAEEIRKKGDEKMEGDTRREEVKPYKPATCIVSGEKLGGMGEPVVFVYQDQEIKLCCKGCRGKFEKDPTRYLKKLDAAK